jgi:cysteine-rich repeat protein
MIYAPKKLIPPAWGHKAPLAVLGFVSASGYQSSDAQLFSNLITISLDLFAVPEPGIKLRVTQLSNLDNGFMGSIRLRNDDINAPDKQPACIDSPTFWAGPRGHTCASASEMFCKSNVTGDGGLLPKQVCCECGGGLYAQVNASVVSDKNPGKPDSSCPGLPLFDNLDQDKSSCISLNEYKGFCNVKVDSPPPHSNDCNCYEDNCDSEFKYISSQSGVEGRRCIGEISREDFAVWSTWYCEYSFTAGKVPLTTGSSDVNQVKNATAANSWTISQSSSSFCTNGMLSGNKVVAPICQETDLRQILILQFELVNTASMVASPRIPIELISARGDVLDMRIIQLELGQLAEKQIGFVAGFEIAHLRQSESVPFSYNYITATIVSPVALCSPHREAVITISGLIGASLGTNPSTTLKPVRFNLTRASANLTKNAVVWDDFAIWINRYNDDDAFYTGSLTFTCSKDKANHTIAAGDRLSITFRLTNPQIGQAPASRITIESNDAPLVLSKAEQTPGQIMLPGIRILPSVMTLDSDVKGILQVAGFFDATWNQSTPCPSSTNKISVSFKLFQGLPYRVTNVEEDATLCFRHPPVACGVQGCEYCSSLDSFCTGGCCWKNVAMIAASYTKVQAMLKKVCQSDSGWSCTNQTCGRSRCTDVCGSRIIPATEGCDDGNAAARDGCSATIPIVYSKAVLVISGVTFSVSDSIVDVIAIPDVTGNATVLPNMTGNATVLSNPFKMFVESWNRTQGKLVLSLPSGAKMLANVQYTVQFDIMNRAEGHKPGKIMLEGSEAAEMMMVEAVPIYTTALPGQVYGVKSATLTQSSSLALARNTLTLDIAFFVPLSRMEGFGLPVKITGLTGTTGPATNKLTFTQIRMPFDTLVFEDMVLWNPKTGEIIWFFPGLDEAQRRDFYRKGEFETQEARYQEYRLIFELLNPASGHSTI